MSAELSLTVTLAVLGAALLHAGWNALLKAAPGGDMLLDMATVVAGSSLVGLLVTPFVPLPDPAAWKFAAASMAIHFAYYVTLAGAYRTGDLSFAYPLMRGTAPLLTTIGGAVFLAEWPSPRSALGIALICSGIVSIALFRRGHHPRAALTYALANAVIVACYTLIDGSGARAAGNALSYAAWLAFVEGIPFVAWVARRRGPGTYAYLRRGWRRGIVGGAASVGAYAIVLWAMTKAPVALIAALRETSVLFAALIGAVWLKEGFSVPRLAGAVGVVLGIAALKL